MSFISRRAGQPSARPKRAPLHSGRKETAFGRNGRWVRGKWAIRPRGVDGQRKCPLSPSALGVRARLRDLTDMAEVKEAPIDYPGRLRRSVEGVGVLYKTCSPATRLEDCPSENRDGPGKSCVSELRRNLAHSPPSHISKMVLSTVHVSPPTCTVDRTEASRATFSVARPAKKLSSGIGTV